LFLLLYSAVDPSIGWRILPPLGVDDGVGAELDGAQRELGIRTLLNGHRGLVDPCGDIRGGLLDLIRFLISVGTSDASQNADAHEGA